MEKFKPGDKVFVKATDAELASMGMTNKKMNRNLRKYESIIKSILVKGGFDEEVPDINSPGGKKTVRHRPCVLNTGVVIPECWLKSVNEKESEETIAEEEVEEQPEQEEPEQPETEHEESEDNEQQDDQDND